MPRFKGYVILKRKLNFEIIPDGCWKCNLHEILSKKAWDFIRQDAKSRSQGKCAICGKKTDRLDAHEKWSYDEEKGIQKLEDVIAVCKDCHSAIHIFRTQIAGNAERVENHYMKVNSCSYAEMRADMKKANEINNRRNAVSEWRQDLSWLKRFIND